MLQVAGLFPAPVLAFSSRSVGIGPWSHTKGVGNAHPCSSSQFAAVIPSDCSMIPRKRLPGTMLEVAEQHGPGGMCWRA